MTKQAQVDEAQTETVPQLLAKAAKATTLGEQQSLLAQAERQTTEKFTAEALGRSLDLTVKESVAIMPRGTHELHTEATDWLMGEGLHATASAQESEHLLIAEASMWFGRVPDFVKEDQEEFRVQAVNKGTYLASQCGEHADSARQAFINETERLYRQGQKTGAIKTSATVGPASPTTSAQPTNPPADPTTPQASPNQDPAHPGRSVNTELPEGDDNTGTPALEREVNDIANGSDASGVRGMAEGYASSQIRNSSLQATAALRDDTSLAQALAGFDVEAASTVPQVGMPTDEFSTGGPGYPDMNTSSDRAPALQELDNYQGWDGSSIVPPGNTGAQAANGDTEPTKDFAGTQGSPVTSSTHAAKVAAQLAKESSMTQASCPTCRGTGHVAVRKQAYSGLPQIDQIVNADETQGQTPLPEAVAYPLTGWGASPQQGQQNVQNAINETEGLISERNAKSPLATTGGQRVANAPDASGWMSNQPVGPAPGGKGAPYPGYSAPTGLDGSSNLGQPDPVYGYGGDNGNQPLQPYGEMEANDVTNNPQEPYDPTQPHNNDQAYRQVAPGMTTQGNFHPDPVIAQAQHQMLAAQQAIAARNRQLGIG